MEYFFREESEGPTPKKMKNSIKKIRRGRGESRLNCNTKNSKLVIIGNNTAGLTGKLESLKRIIQ